MEREDHTRHIKQIESKVDARDSFAAAYELRCGSATGNHQNLQVSDRFSIGSAEGVQNQEIWPGRPGGRKSLKLIGFR